MRRRVSGRNILISGCSAPVLAFGQAKREALRMADIVHEMLRDSILVFKGDDPEQIDSIEKRDDYVDLLDREIKMYLTRLSNESLTPQQSKMEQDLLAFINDLENIGDVVDKNLMELAKKKIKMPSSSPMRVLMK